jgi:drug/metabolite transporter (DMT)-like permease
LTAATAAPAQAHHRDLGLAAASAAVGLFAAGNLLAREASLPGSVLAMYRLYLSFLIFVIVMALRGRRLTRTTLRRSLLGGITFGANLACFFSAIQLTSVVSATLIGNLQPALVMLAAGPVFGERVGVTEVGLTAAAIAGTGVVLVGGDTGVAGGWGGNLLAVASLLLWTAYFIVSKRTRLEVAALDYATAVSLIGALVVTPVVIPVAAAAGEPLALTPGRFAWVAALALVPGTGHLLLNWAHGHIPITVASLLTLGIPLLVAVGAQAFLATPVTAIQWCAIVATTALLAVLVGRRR